MDASRSTSSCDLPSLTRKKNGPPSVSTRRLVLMVPTGMGAWAVAGGKPKPCKISFTSAGVKVRKRAISVLYDVFLAHLTAQRNPWSIPSNMAGGGKKPPSDDQTSHVVALPPPRETTRGRLTQTRPPYGRGDSVLA